MNIFMLDYEPTLAAQQHVDKHVVKMVLESAQLLSAAHRLLDGIDGVLDGEIKVDGKIINPRCYRLTHANHPCAVWVRASAANYQWVYDLMIELDRERQRRFTPVTGKTIVELGEFLAQPPAKLKDIGLTTPAQAMPPEFRDADPVQAYRRYYVGGKRHIAQWTGRSAPAWFS